VLEAVTAHGRAVRLFKIISSVAPTATCSSAPSWPPSKRWRLTAPPAS
jgi:hypothetical protein